LGNVCMCMCVCACVCKFNFVAQVRKCIYGSLFLVVSRSLSVDSQASFDTYVIPRQRGLQESKSACVDHFCWLYVGLLVLFHRLHLIHMGYPGSEGCKRATVRSVSFKLHI